MRVLHQAPHGAAFVHHHPRLLGRARQPQGVLEGVQVPRDGFVRRRHVAWAGQPALHIIPLRPLGGKPVVLRQRVYLDAQRLGFARPIGHIQVTAPPLTCNAVALHTLLDQLHRLQRPLPGTPRVIAPQLSLQSRHATGVADDGLPPVASAGTTAHPVGLQQHDAAAPFGQLQRGVQAGVTAPHHHNIGAHSAAQRRLGRRAPHAGLVIAGGVELGVGVQQSGWHVMGSWDATRLQR